MRTFKGTAIFAVLLALNVHVTSENEDLGRNLGLDSRIFQQVDAAWAKVKNPTWVNAEKVGGIDIKLVEIFKKITKNFDGVETFVPASVIESSFELSLLNEEVKSLDGFFDVFKKYQLRNDVAVWQKEWRKFAEATIQTTPPSVKVSVDKLHEVLTREPKKNLYHQMMKKHDAKMCSLDQSLQQLILNIYTYMHLVQLKGYVMLQFSWMLLRLYGKGSFTRESESEKNKFNRRFDEQMNLAQQVLRMSSNQMQKCEPEKSVEGETYVQITRLLQGYIQNEVDLNNDESCSETCGYYSYAKQYGCFKNKFCAKQSSCTGRIIDCRYIDSDMGVCMADIGSTRRYNWIQYENGRILGTKDTCSKHTVVESWWRWLVLHCSYCFCLCDEPGRNSDRYFSLRPSLSNTTANRVVTGVRFTKQNRIIHIQVQEGELLSHGGINQSSLAWVPVPDYRIDDFNVKEGVDYHTLSWESRALDLDDVKLPPNCLLTGVKLRKLGSHLNLEAECSQFNANEGKLMKAGASKMWLGNDKTDGSIEFPRERLELKKPDVPTRALSGCPAIFSESNMYVEFTYSDLDADAAQTTVPFIDIQPVAPSPAAPLVGVGIYHRGCENSGGYVAPRVFTYDASQHLADSISNNANV